MARLDPTCAPNAYRSALPNLIAMPAHPSEELLQRGYRYALSLTHDRSVAEDLLHDAWVAICERGLETVEPGYLFATIRNRFIDDLRRSKRFPEQTLDEDPVGGTLPFVHPLGIDSIALERALERLNSTEREALYLQAVEGYTVSEVSNLVDRPIGTVSSLIQRAKKKLRAAMALTDDGVSREGTTGVDS